MYEFVYAKKTFRQLFYWMKLQESYLCSSWIFKSVCGVHVNYPNASKFLKVTSKLDIKFI